MKKRVSALLILAVIIRIAILVPMPRVQAAPLQPLYGGTLVVGAGGGDPAHLNVGISSSSGIDIPGKNIIQAIVNENQRLQIVPSLAESWDMSPDGLTITFRLVRNATWHDGVPFTADDVVFNIQNVGTKYEANVRLAFGNLESVTALDNYTVQVKLKSPQAGFMYLASRLKVIPKHLYEGTDIRSNPYNMKPIGTGPFKFQEWVHGDHITLVRNENYWKKGKPYLDKIIFKQIPDAASRVIAAQKGEIDYIPWDSFPNPAAEELSKNPNWRVIDLTPVQDKMSVLYDTINLRHPILGDKRVRTALAYAIDKNFILKSAYFGLGIVATSIIASPLPLYNPKNSYTKISYDPALANRLLDEAGYKKDDSGVRFSFDCIYEMTDFTMVKTAEVLRENFKAVGVNVLLKPMDGAAYQNIQAQWAFDTVITRQAVGPDPTKTASYFITSAIIHTTNFNVAGYSNPRIDELYTLQAGTADMEKRKPYWIEIQDILGTDLPWIPLIEAGFAIAQSVNFENIIKGAQMTEEMDEAYWVKGSNISPGDAESAIKQATQTLETLRGQWYDVSQSYPKLDQAKQALGKGDYLKAYQLAREAVALANPPYLIYAGVALFCVVAIVAGIYAYRRRSARARIAR
jgi:peptide/nickel transport system substrate-binding protein